jgi:predicted nuclease with TOPRIM domain
METMNRIMTILEGLESFVSKTKEIESYKYRLHDMETRYADVQERLRRVEKQNYTMLEQYGSFAQAINAIASGYNGVKDTLKQVSLGYSPREVARMSAEEYRTNVLLPLGLGRRSNAGT